MGLDIMPKFPLMARGLLLLMTVLFSRTGLAGESWPTKPVRIVVPYTAGGIVDVRARFVADRLSKNIGQPVIVENRSGASTVLGMDFVAKAPPDGHTILIISANTFINLPLLLPRLPFDPAKDLTPVAAYSATPFLVLVHPSLGVRTLREFFALAKSKPGQLTYSSAGNGTFVNIAGELVKHAGQVDIVHVPYKGDAPALTDAVAGHMSMTINFPVTAVEFIKSGKLVALMQSGVKRVRTLPEVPTAQEAGYPELGVVPFGGFWISSKTSPPILARIHEELTKVFRSPEHIRSLEDSGSEPRFTTPTEFATLLDSERIRWTDIIKRTGVKLDQ